MNHRRRPLDDDNYIWSWNCAMFPSIDYKIFETKMKKNKKRMNRIDSIAIRFQCKYNPYAQFMQLCLYRSSLFLLSFTFSCADFMYIFIGIYIVRGSCFSQSIWKKRRMEMRTTSHDIKWETNLLSRQN